LEVFVGLTVAVIVQPVAGLLAGTADLGVTDDIVPCVVAHEAACSRASTNSHHAGVGEVGELLIDVTVAVIVDAVAGLRRADAGRPRTILADRRADGTLGTAGLGAPVGTGSLLGTVRYVLSIGCGRGVGHLPVTNVGPSIGLRFQPVVGNLAVERSPEVKQHRAVVGSALVHRRSGICMGRRSALATVVGWLDVSSAACVRG
jgi:hypothetical protein